MFKRICVISLVVWGQLLWGQLNPSQYSTAANVPVTNSVATPITCPLDRANFIQVYIDPSTTEQIFTVTNTNGTTFKVHSGGTYDFGPIPDEFSLGQTVLSVTTATGSATLVVIGMRVRQ